MKYIKGKIEDRKEWRQITNKLPNKEIQDIWEKISGMPVYQIKFLAYSAEFELRGIQERFNRYTTLSNNERKGNTIDNYILKYGEERGRELFTSKNKRCRQTKENFIKRHGEQIGNKKWEDFIERKKDIKGVFIRKHGEVMGLEKYKNYCNRNRGNHSLERQIEKHGEEEGIRRFIINKNKLKLINSLDFLIEKHGKEKGESIFFSKLDKMHSSNKKGYSSLSQKLFREIQQYTNIQEVRFAEHGGEIHIGQYKADFTDINQRKIIEFNGDRFHANPTIYESTDTPNPFNTNLTSQEIWKRDEARLNFLKKNGFDILVIWEKDYKLNPDKCLEEAITFLRKK
jgi:very-short-patch-repair endonuclease